MAVFDKLTGLHNRTMLSQIFERSIEYSQKQEQQIGFITFDLDFFRNINDNFGHATGDEVLREFSEIIKSTLPSKASAFRLGAEEFAVIMSCDSLVVVKDLAESLRIQTSNILIMQDDVPVKITVSAGVAVCNPENANLEKMLNLSDKFLYEAKNQGRNIVVS